MEWRETQSETDPTHKELKRFSIRSNYEIPIPPMASHVLDPSLGYVDKEEYKPGYFDTDKEEFEKVTRKRDEGCTLAEILKHH